MPIQYTNAPDSDYSSGMDARSSENQISQGFLRDLLNGDIIEKRAKKRKGHQGFAGNVPVRVNSMTYDSVGHTISFLLDSAVSLSTSVSLESVRSSPLVIYGRSSTFTSGPFTTSGSTAHYYPGFTVPIRKTLTAPSGTLVIPGTEHDLGTANLFVGTVQSSDLVDRNYSSFLLNSLSIDETSYNVSLGYTLASSINIFTFYSDQNSAVGSSYVATLSHGGAGSQTFTITAGTHNLSTSRILLQLYQETGGSRLLVDPDTFVIQTNGDATITINTYTATTYTAILAAAPTTNLATGSVAATSSGSVIVSGLTKPWVFFGIYIEQTVGGPRELVLPDSYQYDDSTASLTINFTNDLTTAVNFFVYYKYGDVRSNLLQVSDSSVVSSGTDPLPQITIWGLDHSEIYTTKVAREGWVNLIDSFRRSGEQRLVCGLGGNLFAARTYAEVGTAYDYALLYPRLSGRVASDLVIGPAFWATGETPERTRGYITADGASSHWLSITAVQYDNSNGWTKYVLSVPNKQILDRAGSPTSLASVISTAAGLADYLNVEQMSYARHEGSFQIKQILDGTNQITIWCSVPNNSSDYDDAHVSGMAAILTDQITYTSASQFIPADQLVSDALGVTVSTVLSSSGSTIVASDLGTRLEIPGGIIITASRSSYVVPARTANPSSTASVLNLVRGDMLSYTGILRLLRVRSINPDTDRSVTITSDGNTATVTLGSGNTNYLDVGQKILLSSAGDYSGAQTITSVSSSTTFQFASTNTDSVSGTLVGNTIEVDESLSYSDSASDSNELRVENRWIPLEAPTTTFNQPASTHVRYLNANSYTDQPFLRSSMVSNNLYTTDHDDPVYKVDGGTNYRAGIIPWQPGLFLTQDTGASAIINTNTRSIQYISSPSTADKAAGRLEITSTDAQVIPVGTSVRVGGSTKTYTVTDYPLDTTVTPNKQYVLLDTAIDAVSGSSGAITEIAVYRYYFRMNAVDANNNVITSAVTGSEDYVVEIANAAGAAVNLKLVGMPNWDVYDYDRLELQIYRTKKSQAAPFYLVQTIAQDFDLGNGYINFQDVFSDDNITQLDPTSSVLKSGELGIAWSDAPRAKYMTSIGNRLVLANIQDYPQMDLQLVDQDTTTNYSAGFIALKFLFRKDFQDSGTSSDMVNRAVYECVGTSSGTPSSFSSTTTSGGPGFSFHTTQQPTAGDWVYLTYGTTATTGRDLTLCGWWQIAAVTGTGPYTLSITFPDYATPSSFPDTYVLAGTSGNVPVYTGTDGSMGMVSARADLASTTTLFQLGLRVSMAINASMRMVDTSITSMKSFLPWLTARSGNDTAQAGHIVVRQPGVFSTSPSAAASFGGDTITFFVNSTQVSSGTFANATELQFPSRIVVSYPNYPEIFDNVTATLDIQSDSAIDINSADGQEITGVIPFFGEAAFTAAQQAAVLVVFKTNSIYLVDLNQKVAGQNPVQRIETEGLGCTAPYSIAPTLNGIFFANESGMYCMRRTQLIEYLGKWQERNWVGNVDTSKLSLAQGHHYNLGRQYKLSVPITSTETSTGYTENSQVFVYDHTLETLFGTSYSPRSGAWSRYDSHPATGWANLNSDAFWASTAGRVFSIRRTGLSSDFRDDSSPITFQATLRANDFGNGGIRKILDAIIIHYKTGAASTGTAVNYSVDLEQEFSPTSSVVINPTTVSGTGIADTISHDIVSIRHKLARRRGIYFAAQVINNGLDEDVEIAGVEYKIGGLSEKGITTAAQTTGSTGK